ncbi:MAG: glycosyltransferase [Bacteroidetes bacterium]|nr:glycosyltransferase [Bacteroidota bacterium]
MQITIIGLTITSSWGNGHATTYRGLIRELSKNGHDVLFLEQDAPWYANNRDLPHPDYCKVGLYESLIYLKEEYKEQIISADMVIVGSYVPDGVEVGNWVCETAKGIKAFYDIDTPVTLARLKAGDYLYISPELIPKYDLYLSFAGGPTLELLEQQYHSPMARVLYCSVDPELYYPEQQPTKWDLGYLGTYSDDRQPPLEKLMLKAARQSEEYKFIVAGPQYPQEVNWPENVQRIEHIAPPGHREFYNAQRFTLNITRADMMKMGYSPSVRLFEAAACGVPIISDYWEGLESIFEPGIDILISESKEDTLYYLKYISEDARKRIGENARRKVLARHTAAFRAKELENYAMELINVEA